MAIPILSNEFNSKININDWDGNSSALIENNPDLKKLVDGFETLDTKEKIKH